MKVFIEVCLSVTHKNKIRRFILIVHVHFSLKLLNRIQFNFLQLFVLLVHDATIHPLLLISNSNGMAFLYCGNIFYQVTIKFAFKELQKG